MKKIITLLLVALASLQAKAQTNAENAQKFMKAMTAENYTEAASLFDPAVPGLNKEVLEGGWKQITAMFGAYKSHTIPESVDKNAITIPVSIAFEKATQGFALSFNEQHKLVGFIIAPPPAAQTAAEASSASSGYREEEVEVAVNGGSIKGTMMYPEKAGPLRVALIIAGSGATDRNGNSLPDLNTNAYKMLAEALAEKGIASLRYDKRLVGNSNGFSRDESKLRFENYVEDAVAICDYLRKEKQAEAIFIVGHSEGSLIGMLAAEKTPVDAFVSVCGAGENIAKTLQRQIASPEVIPVLDELRNGRMTNSVPDNLKVMFRASVQPYLISWMAYEPAEEIKKLKIPVLVIGGTTDIQVPVADAEMLKAAAPGSALLIVDGMNHVLKSAIADRTANLVTYNQPNLPLHPGFVAGIVSFLSTK